MCLRINDEITDKTKTTYPQEFIVYKILAENENGELFSPLQHTYYYLGKKIVASGKPSIFFNQVNSGCLHCFIDIMQCNHYKRVLEVNNRHCIKYIIVKCIANLDNLIACGSSNPIYSNVLEQEYPGSAAFSELLPLSIME